MSEPLFGRLGWPSCPEELAYQQDDSEADEEILSVQCDRGDADRWVMDIAAHHGANDDRQNDQRKYAFGSVVSTNPPGQETRDAERPD